MNNPVILLAAILAATAVTVSAGDTTNIKLAEIDGRTWLIDPSGNPFFAHGVTHTGHGHDEDFMVLGRALKELGFNAYGYGCPEQLKTDMPYLHGHNLIPMSHYRKSNGSFRFIDIFDPLEQAKLERDIKRTCLSNRDNPNLIGYFWTDLGAWPLENRAGENWVDFIRALAEDAPGQRAYQAFLETWQGDDARGRDLAFLRLIAREYGRVHGEAYKKHDPDHLIFGDRFTFETVVPEVVEELLPYLDGIAIQPNFQPGFPREAFERVHKLTGKPIIICDFAVRFKEEGKQIRGWKPEENPGIAGELYADYLREAIATPYIIGAFWCNPINSKPEFAKSGIKQGLFDHGLVERPELNRAIRELNDHLKTLTPSASHSPRPAPEAWNGLLDDR